MLYLRNTPSSRVQTYAEASEYRGTKAICNPAKVPPTLGLPHGELIEQRTHPAMAPGVMVFRSSALTAGDGGARDESKVPLRRAARFYTLASTPEHQFLTTKITETAPAPRF